MLFRSPQNPKTPFGIFFFLAEYKILHGSSLTLSLPWGAADDVVNSEDHLCGLTGGLKRLLLDSEALSNSQLLHVIDFAAKHVDACSCVAIVNF